MKDILFRNGTVFDGHRFLPAGTWVRVRGGRITGVGPAESLGPLGSAEPVDLDGGTLLPGFIDAHAHPVFAGHQLRHCDLSAASTELEYLVGAQWWDQDQGLEQLPELLHRRVTAGRFRANSIKMMLDGVAENHTAALLEPYLDGDGCPAGQSGSGIDFIDPDRLPEFVAALDREGFQVHFHAIGDRAVRQALDAVAAARARNGPAGGRHHLAQVQVVHPMESVTGSIKTGLDADFAILDADLAAIDPREICQASVRQTWLRGHPT